MGLDQDSFEFAMTIDKYYWNNCEAYEAEHAEEQARIANSPAVPVSSELDRVHQHRLARRALLHARSPRVPTPGLTRRPSQDTSDEEEKGGS